MTYGCDPHPLCGNPPFCNPSRTEGRRIWHCFCSHQHGCCAAVWIWLCASGRRLVPPPGFCPLTACGRLRVGGLCLRPDFAYTPSFRGGGRTMGDRPTTLSTKSMVNDTYSSWPGQSGPALGAYTRPKRKIILTALAYLRKARCDRRRAARPVGKQHFACH